MYAIGHVQSCKLLMPHAPYSGLHGVHGLTIMSSNSRVCRASIEYDRSASPDTRKSRLSRPTLPSARPPEPAGPAPDPLTPSLNDPLTSCHVRGNQIGRDSQINKIATARYTAEREKREWCMGGKHPPLGINERFPARVLTVLILIFKQIIWHEGPSVHIVCHVTLKRRKVCEVQKQWKCMYTSTHNAEVRTKLTRGRKRSKNGQKSVTNFLEGHGMTIS